jgi:hypothetical protein
MAHVGQEISLGPVAGVGRIASGDQFGLNPLARRDVARNAEQAGTVSRLVALWPL